MTRPRCTAMFWQVSPRFTPRPSLSGMRDPVVVDQRVVSPRFTPRPSLSGPRRGRRFGHRHVSPRFTPRPSLSADVPATEPTTLLRVAEVHASAFVERRNHPDTSAQSVSGVAEVHASAFVERRTRTRRHAHVRNVSPRFTPRPSLSAQSDLTASGAGCGCRRGSRLGLR